MVQEMPKEDACGIAVRLVAEVVERSGKNVERVF
jgi:hypothetical protein